MSEEKGLKCRIGRKQTLYSLTSCTDFASSNAETGGEWKLRTGILATVHTEGNSDVHARQASNGEESLNAHRVEATLVGEQT